METKYILMACSVEYNRPVYTLNTLMSVMIYEHCPITARNINNVCHQDSNTDQHIINQTLKY